MRDRFNSFFDRHQIAWEVWMACLALAFVAVGIAQDSTSDHATVSLLDTLDFSITVFFAVEFVSRLSLSRSRGDYLKGHWIDVLALLPAIRYLRLGRLARFLRVLRFLPVLRFLASTERVMTHVKGVSTQNGLQYFAAAVVGLMVASAGIVYLAETGVNPNVKSFDDALWWSAVTLSTVGYGDVYPITGIGRTAAVVVMFGGVLLWGMVAASVATYCLSGRRPSNAVLDNIRAQLDGIEGLSVDELRTLRAALDGILDEEIARKR